MTASLCLSMKAAKPNHAVAGQPSFGLSGQLASGLPLAQVTRRVRSVVMRVAVGAIVRDHRLKLLDRNRVTFRAQLRPMKASRKWALMFFRRKIHAVNVFFPFTLERPLC